MYYTHCIACTPTYRKSDQIERARAGTRTGVTCGPRLFPTGGPCGSRALRRACGRDSAVASENAPSTLSRRPPPAATAGLPRECADTI